MIGRLVEFTDSIETHSIFDAARKQVQQARAAALGIKATTNVFKIGFWVTLLLVPKGAVSLSQVMRVLENIGPNFSEWLEAVG
jgi:hypothetical protein